MSHIPHVVILGGGFGGLSAANELRNTLPSSQVKITVIDKNETKNYVERVQLLRLGDFEKLLSPEFKILHTFGNFDLQKFDATSSDRLIIIAEKNA